jgi:CTP:molybdopterin cytidylyltransferase MocA
MISLSLKPSFPAGEASTLTPVEHDSIVRSAVEIARGRVRVVAGTGSNSTSQAIELTRRAEAAGADAVLSVVPYYNKPMQAGIYAHFQAIAAATTLPIILHDIPSRTIRELADDTLVRLSESKQFIGLRDGSGDMTRPIRLRPKLPSVFRLLSGDDATGLGFLANGGDGCISASCARTRGCRSWKYPSARKRSLQTRSRRSATRISPVRAKAGCFGWVESGQGLDSFTRSQRRMAKTGQPNLSTCEGNSEKSECRGLDVPIAKFMSLILTFQLHQIWPASMRFLR